jgi:DUF4097 and DUF4098 domain-containing protein YvlB
MKTTVSGSGGGRVHGGPGLALALTLVPGILLLGSHEASAQDRIQERHALRADANVEIRAVSHRIEVERWDRAEIEITGDYNSEWEELRVSPDPGRFSFRVESRQRRGSWSRRGDAGRLIIRVPEGVRIDLGSVSGGVDVRGLSGAVIAKTVSGGVKVEGSPRTVSMESVSGTVSFAGNSESVRAQTVSGGVEVEGGTRSVTAQSVSGPVQVAASAPAGSVTLNSVSGRVRFHGPLARDGSVRAESHSGPVELDFTGNLDAWVEISTFSGRIEHQLGNVTEERRQGPRYGPGEELSVVVGSGSARVEAKSFSGRVRVRSGN